MQAVLELESNKEYKNVLEWCLIISLLLHLVFVFGVSKPNFDHFETPKEALKIELAPKIEPPKREPIPTPPKPPVPQTQQKPEPIKPTPQKIEPTPQPVKSQPESVAPPPTQPTVEPHPQPVMTAKPVVGESKPEFVAPPPQVETPKVTGPSESDIDNARNAFRSAAHRELKKNQRYPRIAADRGIEGEVKLNIHLDDNGNVTSVDVAESSGSQPLDDAAVSAAKKSNLKSYFHEILRGRVDSITVTVSFKLTN